MRRKKLAKDNYIFAYYQQITAGKICVGRWIMLLYEILITGLEEKRFFFDQAKADAAIAWIESHCFHTEGRLAPGPLKLELWQKAFLSAIFGIVDENGNTAPYAQLPVQLTLEGEAELVGPSVVTAEGGMTGTYIKTVGKTGEARLTISTDQTEDVTFIFHIV